MTTLRASYTDLPQWARPAHATEWQNPTSVIFNHDLAKQLGVSEEFTSAQSLTGQPFPKGSYPVALAYAGHQFGHFVPSLGDGRALLVGEIETSKGELFEIQLKGSGPTEFSRGGDGWSALGPALREYLISEYMAAVGIPTTRSLEVVRTGQSVRRDTPVRGGHLPGGVLVRVTSSHLRIGSLEYFAARGDHETLRLLVERAMRRNYPSIFKSTQSFPSKTLIFFKTLIERQADLVARWMSVGFIHGVMNTDNTTLSGETIDYGPCAFMDQFRWDQVFSSIDRNGRYAYKEQPKVMQWNLYRLAECLIPLVDNDQTAAIVKLEVLLNSMPAIFDERLLFRMGQKLGIEFPSEADRELIFRTLNELETSGSDFTNYLADRPSNSFAQNPLIIPRNHLVEHALLAAESGDDKPFLSLLEVLRRPFDRSLVGTEWTRPPRPDQVVTETFCGT
jgi:serine/tyrosine/threonine adenylyltransferase